MANNKNKKGFGLVEVIISSTIIIIILGALIFMARSIIGNAESSAVRFQGAQIAQFQIEKVRQIRDTNYIDGKPLTKWNSFLSDPDDLPENGVKYFKIKGDDSCFLDSILSADKDKPESLRSWTYNLRKYYGRLTIEKIEQPTTQNLLQEPEITSNVPAYKVTSEVFWFENVDEAAASNINNMKKVTIVEVITDNRPVY